MLQQCIYVLGGGAIFFFGTCADFTCTEVGTAAVLMNNINQSLGQYGGVACWLELYLVEKHAQPG